VTGRGKITLTLLLVAGIGLLVVSALQQTLTYYRTPTEVLADTAGRGERIRLGGQVVPGTLRRDGDQTGFRVSDGNRQVAVVQRGAPPRTFHEGQDTVVEGVLDAHGVFHSDVVMVKHGNEYRPAETGTAGEGR
jgi:cytochrome c-type biogenesis protein CcmE